MVAELVAAGYGEHIWLAQDLTGAEVSMNPETHGRHGLSYIADVFLPMLVDRGVTAEQCEQLVAGNPARMLMKRFSAVLPRKSRRFGSLTASTLAAAHADRSPRKFRLPSLTSSMGAIPNPRPGWPRSRYEAPTLVTSFFRSS